MREGKAAREPQLTYTTQVPAAFVLCFAPHAYAVTLAGKNYDVGK
jgi:hypothetical protein